MSETIQSELFAAKLAVLAEKAANINREVKELNLELLELRDLAHPRNVVCGHDYSEPPIHIGLDPSSDDDKTVFYEVKR